MRGYVWSLFLDPEFLTEPWLIAIAEPEALALEPLARFRFMFPAVVVLADALGILAGWATSLYLLDLSTPEFLKGLRLFFQPFDVWFSVIKSVTFGLTVTSVGCFFGFHTTGGAQGVGKATTQAVVVSSMIILVLDAFWAATLL